MTRESLRSLVIMLGAAGLLAGLLFACFEKTTRELPVGYSRTALQNPYLAFGRLVERMGREVRFLEGPAGLDELPPTEATLFLPTIRRTLGAERSDAILDWVDAGGNLIVVTYTLWDEDPRRPDRLLDGFGLEQYEHPEPEPEAEPETEGKGEAPADADEAPGNSGQEEAEAEAPPEVARPPELRELIEAFLGGEPDSWDQAEALWPVGGRRLRVEFDPRFYWQDPGGRASWSVGGAAGLHLLRVEHGDGWIWALTDDLFFMNGRIGELDHAELALRLTDGQDGRTGPVWIVVSEEWPGLLAMARTHAGPALLAGAALLVAWLWRASRRFGPIRPDPVPERRRWMEHLEAAGRFHWRHHGRRRLLEGARAGLRERVRARHPGWARLPLSVRAERLADLCGLPRERVHAALDPALPESEAAFVDAIATLERIRTSL